MVLSRDTVTGYMIRNAAGRFTENCSIVGSDCTRCDNPTPNTVTLQIGGATDSVEGGCIWDGNRDFFPFFAHQRTTGLTPNELNNTAIVMRQLEADPCVYSSGLAVAEFLIETFIDTSSVSTCGSLFSSARSSQLNCGVTILPTASDNIQAFGQITATDLSSDVRFTVALSADECVCGTSSLIGFGESGAMFSYTSADEAALSSRTCSQLHLNSFDAGLDTCTPPDPGQRSVATVIVHDALHGVVQSANVTVSASVSGSGTAQGLTDEFGEVEMFFECLCQSATDTLTITNITKDGWGWNTDDDEDSHTSTVQHTCTP